uniref:G protein-coupled receptor 137 n=1 Tax=Panthera tigris altaica TaxID=74533 RepID=A0A8C9K9D9_PANTA
LHADTYEPLLRPGCVQGQGQAPAGDEPRLGTRVCQAAAMGGAMVLLYASRACYNLAALALAPRSRLDAFDYDWYNVSDQADLVNDLGNKGYLVFGLILCVWELLPTALLVGFFRVHGPPQDLVFGSPSDFFDRAGHCEDEGCSWERGRSESTSMSGSLGSGSWYGAMGREQPDTDHCSALLPGCPLIFMRS